MKDVERAALAEFVGTFAFCFIGAGVICTNQWTGGAVGLLGIAVAHGAALAVMISALGHISGGHLNPAVTVGLLAAKKIDARRAATYIVAQLAGAVAAGYLLKAVVPAEVWKPVNLGAPALGHGITLTQGAVFELVMTFFLVLTVFGMAVDPKGNRVLAGLGIGTVLVFDILVVGPVTGAAMNPARAFGPSLASGFWDRNLLSWLTVYGLSPIAGGILAGVLYSALFLEPKKR